MTVISFREPTDILQTRQKFKEAYDLHFAATIERAEKQIILAKHARRLLNLVDDTPIVPGDVHPAFQEVEAARQVLNDAEADLRDYELHVDPIHSNAGNLGVGAMPNSALKNAGSGAYEPVPFIDVASTSGKTIDGICFQSSGSNESGGEVQPPYPVSNAERVETMERQQAGEMHQTSNVA